MRRKKEEIRDKRPNPLKKFQIEVQMIRKGIDTDQTTIILVVINTGRLQSF